MYNLARLLAKYLGALGWSMFVAGGILIVVSGPNGNSGLPGIIPRSRAEILLLGGALLGFLGFRLSFLFDRNVQATSRTKDWIEKLSALDTVVLMAGLALLIISRLHGQLGIPVAVAWYLSIIGGVFWVGGLFMIIYLPGKRREKSGRKSEEHQENDHKG